MPTPPGQVVFIDAGPTSNFYGLNLRVVDGDGDELVARTANLAAPGRFVLQSDTVVIEVMAEDNQLGTYELVVHTVADEAQPIDVGDEVSGAFAAPSTRHAYAFDAVDGQRVFFDQIASNNYGAVNLRLEDPSGAIVLDWTTALTDQGPWTLSAGTWVLWLRAEADATPDYTFQLREAGQTTVNDLARDTVVAGSLDTPGEVHVHRFAATLGDAVFLDAVATSNTGAVNWRLVREGGRVVRHWTTGFVDLGRFALEDGTYRVEIRQEGDTAATYPFAVRSVSDKAVTAAVEGSISNSIDVAGQVVRAAFSAAAGQRLTVDVTAADAFAAHNLRLFDSYGREVIAQTTSMTDQHDVALMGGSYVLEVLGEDDDTGAFSISLVDAGTSSFVPGAVNAAVGDTLGGTVAGGASASHMLSVAEGTRLFFDLDVGANNLQWSLLDGAGRPVFGPTEAQYPTTHNQRTPRWPLATTRSSAATLPRP